MSDEEKLTPERIDILLVDDRAENLVALEGILAAPDYNLVKTTSGFGALELILKQDFALILLDVHMPVMDGFETARLIKQRAKSRHIPIIFLTAMDRDEKFISRGYAAGAVDYIIKPFDPYILKSKVSVFVELHRKNLQLEHLNRKLEKTNEELENFALITSHDLQEPLRKIQTLGDLLEIKTRDSINAEAMDHLSRIRDAARRMQRLLQSLLLYSRLNTKAEPLEEVDLTQTVQKVLGSLEDQVKAAGGDVQIGEMPKVAADPKQISLLFYHLIENALKFHRPEEPPKISISATYTKSPVAGNGRYEIHVQDNGIGFDAKYLDKVFMPFQQLHGRGEYEGVGMGLPICKKIIERHGGAITARSTPGHGSTFIVTLPVKQDQTNPHRSP